MDETIVSTAISKVMQKDLNSLKQQDNWAASYPALYNFVVF